MFKYGVIALEPLFSYLTYSSPLLALSKCVSFLAFAYGDGGTISANYESGIHNCTRGGSHTDREKMPPRKRSFETNLIATSEVWKVQELPGLG